MVNNVGKKRAPRNRTLTLTEGEKEIYRNHLLTLSSRVSIGEIQNSTLHQNLFEAIDYLPDSFVDLMVVDPPYNLTKIFGLTQFPQRSLTDYSSWFESWFPKLLRLLKPNASIYICADWRSSSAVHSVAEKYLRVRNRITWEREKGRGAKSNWKNCAEDIWYYTMSDKYVFNVESVKLKRRVLAPYRDSKGKPKDWSESHAKRFRLTSPSNLWSDLTVPFWSMSENTDHPTQKPEKLLAKIILASSNEGDIVFDPFLGSGTTSVVAKKLGRNYVGIEIDELYCCIAERRLHIAESNKFIQGYVEGVFWERNTINEQELSPDMKQYSNQGTLFQYESLDAAHSEDNDVP